MTAVGTDGIDALLPSVLPTGALISAAWAIYLIVKAWRLRQTGRGMDYSALLEEASRTITRKDAEIDDLKAEIAAIQLAGREERLRLDADRAGLQAQVRTMYDQGEGDRRRLSKYEDEEGNPR